MRIPLKKLSEQVIVITGASSGIGLVTARMAARAGARLVLSSRSEEALKRVAAELTGQGAQVDYAVADVGDQAQVRRIAERAIERFGGFDTWVNNAGISIFGHSAAVPVADMRKLFETNFWGVVHGSLAAAEHLRQRGGALINIGSEVSDVAMPLQAAYSASKHAVKGFTDALRLELEEAGAPVAVTLVKPASIDTLFVPHAKNYMDVDPQLPQPIYAPELAAEAILYAAQHPRRDIYVGGAARLAAAGARIAPRTSDWMLKRVAFDAQRSDRPPRDRDDNALHAPGTTLRERAGGRHVFESSLLTQAELHPRATLAVALGAAALLAVWLLGKPPVPVRR